VACSLLDTHHDITWFDVPVNEFLLVHGSQTSSDLRRDFERQLHLDPALAFDEFFERFSLYERFTRTSFAIRCSPT
jgi:hypothetical protein